MAYRVTVNKETCDGDGECVEICPVDVYGGRL
jgi:NAD-dependent dihydropyrimidine dehydrogenase PreA subunit